MATLNEIKNLVPLTPDIGTSGQPRREQIADIAEAGYRAVVNLALADSDHAIADEGSLVASLGMSYFHIPVRFDAPTREDLETFIGVMRALEDRKVWVHCVVNARVSAFMYHYLRHERGVDESAARSPVLERWAPQMDDTWKAFISLDLDG